MIESTGYAIVQCSISRSTASCAGATSSRSGSATWSAGAGFVRELSQFNRKPAAPFSSTSSSPPVAVYSPGSNVEGALSTTTPSRAGLIMPIISAPGSMRGLSTTGSLGSDCAGRTTALTHSAERRRPSSTSRQVTCAPCKSCSAIRRSRARFAISASISRMRSRWLRARRCSNSHELLDLGGGELFATIGLPNCAPIGHCLSFASRKQTLRRSWRNV